MPKVMLKFKEAVLKEIPLDKDVIKVGRNPDNDIHIDNPAVSGSHAKITNDANRFFIEDMNSTNGTFVNDKRISRLALNNNDVITIGKHTLVFIGQQAATEEDQTVKIKKSSMPSMPSMGETIVIDTRKQKTLSGEKPGVSAEKIGCFTVIEGTADKTEYELTGRLTTIGKDNTAGIKIKGLFAPKVAALINRTKDGYFISPSEGGKKIKVNGNHIEGRYELKDGDILEVWNIKMQFYVKE